MKVPLRWLADYGRRCGLGRAELVALARATRKRRALMVRRGRGPETQRNDAGARAIPGKA